MAKKRGIFGFVQDFVADIILENFSAWVRDTIRNMQKAVYLTLKVILESFLAMSLMILGIGMIVISLPFLLAYYLQLPVSLFFIIVGLLLIAISAGAFHHINKHKYMEE